NHIMLKSGMYPNDDEKSSTCECANNNNTELAIPKGKYKYLKDLKHICIGGICVCSVASALLTLLGSYGAKTAAVYFLILSLMLNYSKYASYVTIHNMFNETSMITAIDAGANATVCGLSDMFTPAISSASAIFGCCSIAALVLIILAVVLIILYIWLYRRRKNSWKHECKKHLCK
ncbi:stevor, partial [Plasmodium reichenowi]